MNHSLGAWVRPSLFLLTVLLFGTGGCGGKAPGYPCALDTDCSNGDDPCIVNVCRDSMCTPEPVACPSGEVCDADTGSCVEPPSCMRDTECAAGQVCLPAGVCGPGSTASCGDGTVDMGEVCDGSNLGDATCASVTGMPGGALACGSDCTAFDTTGCMSGAEAMCGNDTAEGSEVCDGADLSGASCETVPGGFTGGSLTCASDCMAFDTSACTTGPDTTCAYYCATLDAQCAGFNFPYNDVEDCLLQCRNALHLDPGMLTDTSGNTLGCRIHNAEAGSTTGTSVECRNAGASGGDVCGGRCENFCAMALANCPDSYTDMATCVSACASYAVMDDPFISSGDSFECRQYHAVQAALHARDVECRSVGSDGGGECRDFFTGGGETCATATPVSAEPFTDFGSGPYSLDDYSPTGCAGAPTGTSGADGVYEFTPSFTGEYTLGFGGDRDVSQLYVVTDCAAISTSCVGFSDTASGISTGVDLTVTLTAGTTYFIIVDSDTSLSTVAGAGLNITSTLASRCGNGRVDHSMEQCDGTDLDSKTCANLGMGRGTLSCDTNCMLVTTGCSGS